MAKKADPPVHYPGADPATMAPTKVDPNAPPAQPEGPPDEVIEPGDEPTAEDALEAAEPTGIAQAQETRKLNCALSDERMLYLGKRQSSLLGERGRIEGEKDTANEQFKARLKANENEIADITDQMNSGSEFRDVEVNVEYDYNKGEVRVFRLDTEPPVLVESRKMTNEERQTTIE